MTAAPILVLGTRNRKKASELIDLLRPLGIEVRVDDGGQCHAESERDNDPSDRY